MQEANAQHDLGAQRRPASILAKRVQLDQREQLRPRHHAVHLVEEIALAGLAAGQVQPEVGLPHAFIVSAHAARRQGLGGHF